MILLLIPSFVWVENLREAYCAVPYDEEKEKRSCDFVAGKDFPEQNITLTNDRDRVITMVYATERNATRRIHRTFHRDESVV